MQFVHNNFVGHVTLASPPFCKFQEITFGLTLETCLSNLMSVAYSFNRFEAINI